MFNPSHILIKGSGSTGCLLNPNNQDEPQFISLSLSQQIKSIQLSGLFAMTITNNHHLYIWGSFSNLIIDKPLKMMQCVSRISCGWYVDCKAENKLYGMGNNSNKELGINTELKYLNEPILIWEKTINYFCAGFRQSYLISDNILYGCGQSKKYQLGIAEPKPSNWRKLIDNGLEHFMGDIQRIDCGKRFLLMLTKDKKVYVFGNNQKNCFNKENIREYTIPTLIFEDVEKFACGWAHIVLLKSNGSVLSYGRNNLGQLGRSQNQQKLEYNLFQDQQIIDVFSGTQFSFALSSKNRVFGWGWNQHFNLTKSKQIIILKPVVIQNQLKAIHSVVTNPAITILIGKLQ